MTYKESSADEQVMSRECPGGRGGRKGQESSGIAAETLVQQPETIWKHAAFPSVRVG